MWLRAPRASRDGRRVAVLALGDFRFEGVEDFLVGFAPGVARLAGDFPFLPGLLEGLVQLLAQRFEVLLPLAPR